VNQGETRSEAAMVTEKRASGSTTSKKRTRKASANPEGANLNATQVGAPVARAAEQRAKSPVPGASLEEQIRTRAYELYLRRKGQPGSAEQDWFQAAAEINSQHSA